MPDQIAVYDPMTLTKLFFPPTVEQISRAGLSLKIRLQFRGLPLDKVLRLTVAGVMDNREVEPQAPVEVSRPELRQGPSGKTLGIPGTQEMLNRLLQLVLSQTPRRRNADLFSKLLEVVGVPIAVVELCLRHECGELNGSWRLYGCPFVSCGADPSSDRPMLAK